MAKITKAEIIKNLEEQVNLYKTCLAASEKKNAEFMAYADEVFSGSPQKLQLEQEKDFLKALYEDTSNHYDCIKKRTLRKAEAVQSIYEDNRVFAARNGFEYQVGMTASADKDYTKLLEEKLTLEAKVENREEKIALFMQEIQKLQWEVADLKLYKIA